MHHSAWLQDFSGGSSIDLLQTPQPADFDLFLNDGSRLCMALLWLPRACPPHPSDGVMRVADERHLANAMLECSQVDSEGHTLPPPTTMSPFRQRYDMGAAHQMRPPFRTASPGQQVARCGVLMLYFGFELSSLLFGCAGRGSVSRCPVTVRTAGLLEALSLAAHLSRRAMKRWACLSRSAAIITTATQCGVPARHASLG